MYYISVHFPHGTEQEFFMCLEKALAYLTKITTEGEYLCEMHLDDREDINNEPRCWEVL